MCMCVWCMLCVCGVGGVLCVLCVLCFVCVGQRGCECKPFWIEVKLPLSFQEHRSCKLSVCTSCTRANVCHMCMSNNLRVPRVCCITCTKVLNTSRATPKGHWFSVCASHRTHHPIIVSRFYLVFVWFQLQHVVPRVLPNSSTENSSLSTRPLRVTVELRGTYFTGILRANAYSGDSLATFSTTARMKIIFKVFGLSTFFSHIPGNCRFFLPPFCLCILWSLLPLMLRMYLTSIRTTSSKSCTRTAQSSCNSTLRVSASVFRTPPHTYSAADEHNYTHPHTHSTPVYLHTSISCT